MDVYRQVRDQIELRVLEFLDTVRKSTKLICYPVLVLNQILFFLAKRFVADKPLTMPFARFEFWMQTE